MDEVTEIGSYQCGGPPFSLHSQKKQQNWSTEHSSHWPAAYWLWPGCSGLLCTWTDCDFTTQIRQVQNYSAETQLVPIQPVSLEVPIKFAGINTYVHTGICITLQCAFKLIANCENLAIQLWAWKPYFQRWDSHSQMNKSHTLFKCRTVHTTSCFKTFFDIYSHLSQQFYILSFATLSLFSFLFLHASHSYFLALLHASLFFFSCNSGPSSLFKICFSSTDWC